jgi:hypothetical protein
MASAMPKEILQDRLQPLRYVPQALKRTKHIRFVGMAEAMLLRFSKACSITALS